MYLKLSQPKASFMENQNTYAQPTPGLFGKPQQQPMVPQEFSEQVTTSLRRLRVLEERYSTIHRKTQVYEQNSLVKNRKFDSDIKTINEDLRELKKEINEVKDKMIMLVSELQSCAKREEVEILKKYLNLWEPLNFITRNELKKILDDVVEEKLREVNKVEEKNKKI